MVERKPKRAVCHVTSDADGTATRQWQGQHEGDRRGVRELHRTRQEAILAARQQAKQHEPSQVVVHGRDGRIRTEYAYGDDPGTSPAGTRQVDAMVLRPPLEPMLAQAREAVPAPGCAAGGPAFEAKVDGSTETTNASQRGGAVALTLRPNRGHAGRLSVLTEAEESDWAVPTSVVDRSLAGLGGGGAGYWALWENQDSAFSTPRTSWKPGPLSSPWREAASAWRGP
jgi:hypothetical protein